MLKKPLTKLEYYKALDTAHEDPESYKIIEDLIHRYINTYEHLQKTSLWDIFEYEKRLLQPVEIIAYDNVKLKKEVNQLRKKLGMVEKYKTEDTEELED